MPYYGGEGAQSMIYQCVACGDLVSDMSTPKGGYCSTSFDQHAWMPVGLEGAMVAIILKLKDIQAGLEDLGREVNRLDYRTREVDE